MLKGFLAKALPPALQKNIKKADDRLWGTLKRKTQDDYGV